MVQVKLAKTKELVLDAVESALDSEDTELSEEMVWEDYCQNFIQTQLQLIAACYGSIWKLWNLMQNIPYMSILFHASHGKGLPTFGPHSTLSVSWQELSMQAVVVEPNDGAPQSSDSDATDKDFEVQSRAPRVG